MSGRICLTAVKSGSGKTTIASGLLYALTKRGIRTDLLKCGPDYIDTMYAKAVPGVHTGNLDSFLLSKGHQEHSRIVHLVQERQKEVDLLLLEGAMGYYDGVGFTSKASCYEIATWTRTPVILVVDCRGMGASLVAVIRGFLAEKKPSGIVGVICSRISEKLYREAAPKIEALGVRSLGYVPNQKEWTIGSRHLGLVTPTLREETLALLGQIGEKLEQTVDIDGILAMAAEADNLSEEAPNRAETLDEPTQSRMPANVLTDTVNIAVARDEAFCFLYEDNLRAMEQAGLHPVFFSPMEDAGLPPDCSGLYLCGGYPELYAETLQENRGMRQAIREAIQGGMPTVAECGGFLYLQSSLDNGEQEYEMAGVLSGSSKKCARLQNFGYHWMVAKEDSLLFRAGERMPVHEFHYYQVEHPGDAFLLQKEGRKEEHLGGIATKFFYGGFPHLYFEAFPELLLRWKEACHAGK